MKTKTIDPNYKVLIFYKFIEIESPEHLRDEQKQIWEKLNLKGRGIVARTGVNITLGGKTEDVEKYIETMKKDERFADVWYKTTDGTGDDFPKIQVKVKDELVTTRIDKEITPLQKTGKYITADELHEWFEQKKEFYIVDMRNDYEFAVGHFENSILPSFTNFRDLPTIIDEIEHLKDKCIVTVCTFGVRCEIASIYLEHKGFKEVYQLHGGIGEYMRKYPNQHFIGKLYTFDGRYVLAFNEDDPAHQVIGKCVKTGLPSDNYVDCAYYHCAKPSRHFICHPDYVAEHGGKVYCSDECERLAQEQKEVKI